ncbi:hypothetical protein M947_11380 [Sulfurimonas hongkongensis]|uniref:UDP-N-acetylglucosamine--peptide N-acetylglucosaminyltransferase SPINDLY n=1 Tax=Sulfurimonas hongkongensis TaxID=1172190 RepID=T0JC00_9BACT|nr:sulfotransferase [Sulfurimonas hongkongensis]EQB34362.1 hypothetical protein M947_11380 [Sulfurimonas hongkongensis]
MNPNTETIKNNILELYNAKKYKEAIEEAKKHDFDNLFLYNLMASCYKYIKEYENSLEYFQKALAEGQNYHIYYNLANLYEMMEKYDDAIKNYELSLSLEKNQPLCLQNIGHCHMQAKRSDKALAYLKKAYKLDKKNAAIANSLATAYKDVSDASSATKYYKEAIKLDPKNPNGYNNIGVHYMNLNEKEKALECYAKALEIKPDDMVTHRHITMISKYDKDSDHLAQMLEFEKKTTDKEQLCQLCYALAKAHEDIGDYDKFFHYLNLASELRLQTNEYDFQKETNTFKLVKYFHNKHKDSKVDKRKLVKGKQPIFVIGMPRSGTTLVEQILSSHSSVHGAGELYYFSNLAKKTLEKVLKKEDYDYSKEVANLRKGYYEAIKAHNIKEPIFVDKMPENFKFVHMMIDAFPEAKIVHLNRDPMAVCWSMYKQYFHAGIYYSCNQRYLGRFHKLYQHIMKYYNEAYGNKIYNLNYEALTENQEEETRKLLEYCELPWEDSCLEFHKNKRAVATASNQQVRKGMYKGSSKAWKKYEKYLQPLMEELDKEGCALDNKALDGIYHDTINQIRHLKQLMGITQTARNVYANALKKEVPKKQAPKGQTQGIATINDKNYLIDDLSQKAKEYLASYKASQERVELLERKLEIAKTALQQ